MVNQMNDDWSPKTLKFTITKDFTLLKNWRVTSKWTFHTVLSIHTLCTRKSQKEDLLILEGKSFTS